ncbi:thioredoxin reductase, partial [Candidatus Woesearchaeota archaeon CG10_big_fil_rev_8_21_14_0_10_47_5]
AMGMSHKKLGIPGEEEFLGKGVSYCAVCDAPFFKDKGVAVIGGSDTAAHSALLLTKYASKVIVICRRGELTAAPAYKAMLEGNKGIEIKTNTSVAEISGDGMVSSLLLGSGERIGVEGVFIESGGVPAAVLAGKLGIKLDDEGFIVTDPMQRTNVEGLFAAGDVTSVKMKQILWATSQGAVAASSAYEFIKEH